MRNLYAVLGFDFAFQLSIVFMLSLVIEDDRRCSMIELPRPVRPSVVAPENNSPVATITVDLRGDAQFDDEPVGSLTEDTAETVAKISQRLAALRPGPVAIEMRALEPLQSYVSLQPALGKRHVELVVQQPRAPPTKKEAGHE